MTETERSARNPRSRRVLRGSEARARYEAFDETLHGIDPVCLGHRQVWGHPVLLSYIYCYQVVKKISSLAEASHVKALAYFMLHDVPAFGVPAHFLLDGCKVSSVISGGQLKRMGRSTVPKPAFV